MYLGRIAHLFGCFIGISVLLFSSGALAAKIVKVTKVDDPPVIDGKLDDLAWQKASVFTDFKTLRPDFGLPPSEKTEVYMIYDRENIYIGFRCFDSEHEKIMANAFERDNLRNNDWIAFCLDTFNEELGGYFFGVNPLGIQMDGILNSSATPDTTFNIAWSSDGRLTHEGYFAEIAIPFKNLPFPSEKTSSWVLRWKEVFHFKKNVKEELVSSIFQSLEYNEGKKIEDFERLLKRTETAAFIVILNDAILYEKYFNGYQRDSMVTSFSVAKSFVSTLVGIAIDEGLIGGVNDPITKYIPELREKDTQFSSITIKDLLLMSSGFKFREGPPDWDNGTIYFHPDLRKVALERTKIVDKPGKHFLYNNYNPLLIGLVLERVTKKTVSEYLQEKLWEPLGMEFPGSWSTDSEKSGFEKMVCGVNARAVDFAKFGRLFLKNGSWGKKQIVSSKRVSYSRRNFSK